MKALAALTAVSALIYLVMLSSLDEQDRPGGGDSVAEPHEHDSQCSHNASPLTKTVGIQSPGAILTEKKKERPDSVDLVDMTEEAFVPVVDMETIQLEDGEHYSILIQVSDSVTGRHMFSDPGGSLPVDDTNRGLMVAWAVAAYKAEELTREFKKAFLDEFDEGRVFPSKKDAIHEGRKLGKKYAPLKLRDGTGWVILDLTELESDFDYRAARAAQEEAMAQLEELDGIVTVSVSYQPTESVSALDSEEGG